MSSFYIILYMIFWPFLINTHFDNRKSKNWFLAAFDNSWNTFSNRWDFTWSLTPKYQIRIHKYFQIWKIQKNCLIKINVKNENKKMSWKKQEYYNKIVGKCSKNYFHYYLFIYWLRSSWNWFWLKRLFKVWTWKVICHWPKFRFEKIVYYVAWMVI